MNRLTRLVRRWTSYLFRSRFRETYKFKKWQKGFEDVYADNLKQWQHKTGSKTILPERFDDKILQQYTNYKTEQRSRQLVYVTWVLAGIALAALALNISAFKSQNEFYMDQIDFFANQTDFLSTQLTTLVSRDPEIQLKLENGFVQNNSIPLNDLSRLAFIYPPNASKDYDYPQNFIFHMKASNRGQTPTGRVTFILRDNENLFYVKPEQRDLGTYMEPPADINYLTEYKDCAYRGNGIILYRQRSEVCAASRDTNLTTGIKTWTLRTYCEYCITNPQCYTFDICVYNQTIEECGPNWPDNSAQFIRVDCPE